MKHSTTKSGWVLFIQTCVPPPPPTLSSLTSGVYKMCVKKLLFVGIVINGQYLFPPPFLTPIPPVILEKYPLLYSREILPPNQIPHLVPPPIESCSEPLLSFLAQIF